MNEPKYKTFRDLRSVSKESAKEEKPAPASSTSTPSRTRSSSTPSIAPERDFQRVPNSVTREALPQGLFRGKSKQVYDYLYYQTRGAMNPRRSIRKSRKEILKGSGLGSMVTVDAALEHLQRVGLLAVRHAVGSLNGNEYEVFTPEETSTSTSSISSTTSPTQKVVVLDVLESSSTSTTQTIDSTDISGAPKTKIKDKDQIDDEAFALLCEKLQLTSSELTGKRQTSADRERWGELADLLATELKIAAARTGTVSNVPAFLTEHLRRRLFKRSKEEMQGQSRQASQTQAGEAVEANQCPDCGGSGWWYPEGTDKGVARCKHARLSKPQPQPD